MRSMKPQWVSMLLLRPERLLLNRGSKCDNEQSSSFEKAAWLIGIGYLDSRCQLRRNLTMRSKHLPTEKVI